MASKSGAKTAKSKGRTRSRAEKETGSCFVLMPFGGWFNQYFERVYIPAIVSAGLSPKRADDIFRPGTVVNDIWNFTKDAKLLLADLTDRNPNVFYELGLAHALAKPVILVTASIDQVPFDLRALRVIEYEKNDPTWGDALKDKITTAIRQVLDAPLEAVLPAFLKVEQHSKQGAVTENEKALLELRRDIDLLRREIRHGSLRSRRSVSSPEEAERLIRLYTRQGMPIRYIREKLIDMGAPRGWVEEHVQELEFGPTAAAPAESKNDPEKAK